MRQRKAINLLRRQNVRKHGGGRTWNESVLRFEQDGRAMLDSIECVQATPDAEAQMQESFQLLLTKLADRELEQIALLKPDGMENTAIASQLECTLRSIERRVHLIRKIWCLELKESVARGDRRICLPFCHPVGSAMYPDHMDWDLFSRGAKQGSLPCHFPREC